MIDCNSNSAYEVQDHKDQQDNEQNADNTDFHVSPQVFGPHVIYGMVYGQDGTVTGCTG